MSKLSNSHSSPDDGFVCDLRAALADHGQAGWIDSRALRGGDLLWPEIQKATEEASGFAVVISTDALQSKWVGKELKLALKLQKKRDKDEFPVIPLSLNGTKLGILEEFFGDEPLYIPVSNDAGGVEAAMNAVLIAMGKRKAADVPANSRASGGTRPRTHGFEISRAGRRRPKPDLSMSPPIPASPTFTASRVGG